MQKIYLLLGFLSAFNINAQTLLTTSGSSSVDISIIPVESGKIYYMLRKTIMPQFSAQQIKDSALSVRSTGIIKKGLITVNNQDINQNLTQSLSELQINTGYYLYTSFEPLGGKPVNQKEVIVKTKERFEKIIYKSNLVNLKGINLEYLIYKPESYFKDNSARKYPVLFFFHGDGEKKTSKNTIDLLKVSPGLTKLVNEGRNLDFIVVSVQMPVSISWITPGWLNELVEKVKLSDRIDNDRIYVSGYSGGGGGMYYLAATQPAKIAAVVPVAAVNSFWNDKTMEYCSIKNIPLWGFHGENDKTVTINNLKEPCRQVSICAPVTGLNPVITSYTDQNGNHGAIPFAVYNTERLYEWLLSKSKLSLTNLAPVISANTLLTAVSGSTVTINADASDSNGISYYEWIKKSGPDLTLQAKNTSKVMLKNLLPGTYNFRLLVTDALKSTSFKDITLKVSNGIITNQPPAVFAGPDREIAAPLTTITINGSASDADGSISSYKWSQVSGPNTGLLTNASTQNLAVQGLVTGKYTFRLTATDNSGNQGFDEVVVNVTSSTSPSSGNNARLVYSITFPQGTVANKWKDMSASVFYKSPVKIQLSVNDPKKIKHVEYILNGVSVKDEWPDPDPSSGKYNYFYTFYALNPGSYTVQVIINEISGNRIKSDVSFSIADNTQAREEYAAENLHDTYTVYELYSLHGVLLASGSGKINYNTLSSGIYLLKTENGTNRILVE